MHHGLVHLVLSLHLAVLTPALCCCDFKVLLGAMTGIEVEGCGSRRCGAAVERDAHVPPCCRAGKEAEAATDSETCPCRCHEQSEVTPKLDTGLKVTVPALALLALPPVAGTAIAPAPATFSKSGHDPRRGRPPDLSLVARHCLLLL
jgi:hypothetical protein